MKIQKLSLVLFVLGGLLLLFSLSGFHHVNIEDGNPGAWWFHLTIFTSLFLMGIGGFLKVYFSPSTEPDYQFALSLPENRLFEVKGKSEHGGQIYVLAEVDGKIIPLIIDPKQGPVKVGWIYKISEGRLVSAK